MVRGRILGTTAEKVSRHAHCSVLIASWQRGVTPFPPSRDQVDDVGMLAGWARGAPIIRVGAPRDARRLPPARCQRLVSRAFLLTEPDALATLS